MWKKIINFPNYSISDDGQVRNDKTQRILSPGYNQDGYAIVQLWENKNPSMKRIHRLVLEAFCPIENSQNFEVNHLDRNVKNNCLTNLEWCTSIENIKYRDNKDNPNRKAKRIKVEFLNGDVKLFDSLTECAEYFNLEKSTVNSYIKSNLSPKRKIQAKFTYV